MLHELAGWSVKALIKHGAILQEKKAIYLYGFELFWSNDCPDVYMYSKAIVPLRPVGNLCLGFLWLGLSLYLEHSTD